MPRPSGQNHGEAAKWLAENVDSSYSPAQWEAWVAEGGYDPACPDSAPFRSARQGTGGACVAKPVDCPEGMFLHGETCYPEGTVAPGGFTEQGRVGAGGTAPAKAPSRALTLQDMLVQMFTNRKGACGLPGGRGGFAAPVRGRGVGGGAEGDGGGGFHGGGTPGHRTTRGARSAIDPGRRKGAWRATSHRGRPAPRRYVARVWDQRRPTARGTDAAATPRGSVRRPWPARRAGAGAVVLMVRRLTCRGRLAVASEADTPPAQRSKAGSARSWVQGAPSKWILPQPARPQKPYPAGRSAHPSRKRTESPNRNSVRPRKRGFPGTGPVVDPAMPRRPGPQATSTERWYKAGASQAPRAAKGPTTGYVARDEVRPE